MKTLEEIWVSTAFSIYSIQAQSRVEEDRWQGAGGNGAEQRRIKPFGKTTAAVLISSMILLVAENIPLPLGDHFITNHSKV